MKLRTATAERKGKIIEIAKTLFFTNGYDNTSIRELAEATGLSVAGVYYFFKDKEDILYTILRQSIIDLNNATGGVIVDTASPEENIRNIIVTLCRHSVSHKKELVILNREEERLNSEQREVIFQCRRESYNKIKNEICRLQAEGKMRGSSMQMLVFSIYSNTTWFSRWYNEDGSMTLEALASEMADNMLSGMLK